MLAPYSALQALAAISYHFFDGTVHAGPVVELLGHFAHLVETLVQDFLMGGLCKALLVAQSNDSRFGVGAA